jgi:hypothetical protein
LVLLKGDFKMAETKSKLPWISEPTIWTKFWAERSGGDLQSKKKLYRENKEIQEQYRWFSLGFFHGGCS